LDGIDKEKEAGWRFVEHTISIAEFFVELEVALCDRADIRLLERAEILEDASPSRRERQVQVEASIHLDDALKRNSIKPDALFGLRFNDEEESYFMLEIDRGEMPVERYRGLYRTYFAKKMLTYLEATRQRHYSRELGIENFRVATVTTTSDRVREMLEALTRLTDERGSSLFLFTNQTTLASSNPLDIQWVSGTGEFVRLTD
jgi:hypothetical protein